MTAIQRALIAAVLLSLPASGAELTQRLDAVAAKHFKENEPGAAVVVMRAGSPLLRKGYGIADLEQGTKITPESVFRLASITKQFTAVAILQLVQGGKVALDDPIVKHLPDVPTHGKTITVEHLLTHTSGIVSYTSKTDLRKRLADDVKPAEIVDSVRNDPLQFDPGKKWAYNNSGYALLGMIIEAASGMSYVDYLEKHVYPRAGLTSTRYGYTSPIVPRRVAGYVRARGKIINAGYVNMTIPYAAGALISTVDHLGRWNAALAAGKVVDRSLLDKAWTPYRLASGRESGYGYGWRIRTIGGERAIHHGGSIRGFQPYVIWMPAHDVFVAVLSNDQSFDPDFLPGLLALEASGKPWHAREVSMTSEELAVYAGVYSAGDERLAVTQDDGKLYAQPDDGARSELFPVGNDEFRFRQSFFTMTFERDAPRNVVAVTLDLGGSKSRATKTSARIRTENNPTGHP